MQNAWSRARVGWSDRINRAIELTSDRAGASEVLTFYSRILELQRAIHESIDGRKAAHSGDGSPLRDRLDLDKAAAAIPALIALVREHGPARLAEGCAQTSRSSVIAGLDDTIQWLQDGRATPQDATIFLSRVALEPLAEHVACASGSLRQTAAGNRCPICQSLPQLAVIRPEGDGGKRLLLCALCHSEWEFRRVLCPACGEQNHEKLPRFTAEGIPALRVEACDTCLTYLKSVDMTIDGLAVPLVDEVAAAPLDLWAAEHGYRKIVRNIMGF